MVLTQTLAYELLNLRTDSSFIPEIRHLSTFIILCGISKGTFEIPHKKSYPYIAKCIFEIPSNFNDFAESIVLWISLGLHNQHIIIHSLKT